MDDPICGDPQLVVLFGRDASNGGNHSIRNDGASLVHCHRILTHEFRVESGGGVKELVDLKENRWIVICGGIGNDDGASDVSDASGHATFES